MRAGQSGVLWCLITLFLYLFSWFPFYISQFTLEEENPTKENDRPIAIRTPKFLSHPDLGVCVEAKARVGRERGLGEQVFSSWPGPTIPPCSAMANIYWTSGKVAKSTLCPHRAGRQCDHTQGEASVIILSVLACGMDTWSIKWTAVTVAPSNAMH